LASVIESQQALIKKLENDKIFLQKKVRDLSERLQRAKKLTISLQEDFAGRSTEHARLEHLLLCYVSVHHITNTHHTQTSSSPTVKDTNIMFHHTRLRLERENIDLLKSNRELFMKLDQVTAEKDEIGFKNTKLEQERSLLQEQLDEALNRLYNAESTFLQTMAIQGDVHHEMY
jgi:predicted nuclease with TOPRIM domain